MKKTILGLMVITLAGLAFGQLRENLSQREIRDPRLFEIIMNTGNAYVNSSLDALGDLSGTLEPGKIYVGNATSNAAQVAVSGDVTIATNGVVTIEAGAIDNAKVANDAAIVGSKLDLSAPGTIGGTTPAAGTFTTLTGSTVVAGTLTGLLKGTTGTVSAATAGTDYLAPGLTFTNSVAEAVTNLVIVVDKGLVTSITINATTTP